MDQTKVILLAAPRTGSFMITEALSTVDGSIVFPAIFSENEWNNPRQQMSKLRSEVSPKWAALSERVAHPEDLLEEIVAAHTEYKLLGFKHMVVKEHELTRKFLLDSSWKKILLSRRNILAAYSSNKTAVMARENRKATGKFERVHVCAFDEAEFTRFARARVRLYDRTREFAKAHSIPLFEVEYTDVRKPEGFKNIMDFLGAEGKFEFVTLKRNSDDTLSRFHEPDVVRSHLDKIGHPEWASEE